MVLPDRPPALVYLDLFVYIKMAEVEAGMARPGYAELLDACRRARAERRALFPLSSTHVLELCDIASVELRRARVAVMEELSNFNYLLGRPQIQELEVEAALGEIPGVDIAPQGPFPLLGPSALWAFGRRGGLVTNAPDPNATAAHVCPQLGIEVGDDAMENLNRWAERQLLTGPDDHNDPVLQRTGYTLDVWRNMLEQRAEQERHVVRELDKDPGLRRGRLRDAVNALEQVIELEEVLRKTTAPLSTSLVELLESDRAKLRDFTDRMPSTRTAVSLKTHYHRDGQKDCNSNDINDIDALAIAVPYCDAVFTDKAARNGVVSSKELEFLTPSCRVVQRNWPTGSTSARHRLSRACLPRRRHRPSVWLERSAT
ncbi:hypothetical protein [Mycobacterium sp.]|uniref:hypothetical protein n=1 Tax=Mycobacterium sp. TaxID=1785 RepID=UPI003C70F859